MIDADLRLHLLKYPGITDQVGARVYPALLPEDEVLPAIVYTQISHAVVYSNSGSCTTDTRWQIDSYATTLNDARQLDDTIQAVLGGYRGMMGTRRVTAFQRNTTSSLMEDEGVWRISSDYAVLATAGS